MPSARSVGLNENISTLAASGSPDYTNPQTWENDTDNNLVSLTQSEVLEVTGIVDGSINLTGATTNSSYRRILRPASGEKHDGTGNSGAGLIYTSGFATPAVYIGEGYVCLQDLLVALNLNNGFTTYTVRVILSGQGSEIVGVILPNSQNAGAGIVDGFVSTSGGGGSQAIVFADCLVYGSGARYHYNLTANITHRLLNCGAADAATYNFSRVAGTVIAKNCWAVGAGSSDYFGTYDAASANNAAEDGSAPGSDSVTGAATFVDAASGDYHLDAADTVCKGQGVDLSADTFAFDDDIDGDTITLWSIGPDAQVDEPAAAGGSPPVFSKSGMITVTLSVAPDLPDSAPKTPRQVIGRAWGGRYAVATKSVADRQWTLVFEDMPSADHDALWAFLAHPRVNWSERPFTYTDVDSNAHQVRFLDGDFPAPEIAPGLHRVTLRLALDRGPLD